MMMMIVVDFIRSIHLIQVHNVQCECEYEYVKFVHVIRLAVTAA